MKHQQAAFSVFEMDINRNRYKNDKKTVSFYPQTRQLFSSVLALSADLGINHFLKYIKLAASDPIPQKTFTMKHPLFKLFLLAVIITIASCAKGPGEGGKSTIHGKVTIINYNSSFTTVQATYPAQGESVYIVYGDDRTYGNSVKTNYDGTYEFPYLRPGKYTIFAYEKDTVKYLNGVPSQAGSVVASKTHEVIQTVEISDKKQDVEAQEMILVK